MPRSTTNHGRDGNSKEAVFPAVYGDSSNRLGGDETRDVLPLGVLFFDETNASHPLQSRRGENVWRPTCCMYLLDLMCARLPQTRPGRHIDTRSSKEEGFTSHLLLQQSYLRVALLVPCFLFLALLAASSITFSVQSIPC